MISALSLICRLY